MAKVAVVILNWNGQKLLENFLPSVIENTQLPDVNITVIDNASTDESMPWLRENYSTVEIVLLAENYGFAEGYNKGLEQVDAEYYVLLNSDVEVAPNWLEPIISYLDEHKDIAVVQPKILSYRNKSKFEYAGAAGGFIDKLGFPFCRGRIFDNLEDDHGQYNAIADVFWASGACMVVRANDFRQNGGFDPLFFAHMEEIDFCWRIKARGKRIICFPQSTVYHLGGGTLNEDSPRKVYLNFRNNMLMLFKNLDERQLKSVLRKRFFYNYIAAYKFLLQGDKDKYLAVLDGHKDFKRLQKDYLSKRQDNLAKTQVAIIPEIYTKNILLDYYIRGKKKFSQLRF